MADLDPVSAFLARGPMPLAQSAKIVGKVCELLAPLHEARRGHGAITPDNVFFHHVGGDLTVELRNVAAPTSLYATPERAQGRTAGPSSDVYSLGILFFHMITGVAPVDHLTEGPPAFAQNELQDIPLELEALVRAMMSREPSRRPGVRKIADEIDNLDLDSTVMGVRIQAALDAEPDVDTRLLQNVKIDLEGRTDPHIIDPYADTLIKNRSELLGLDDAMESQDTFLTLPTIKKPTSGWNEDRTKILDHPGEMEAELPQVLDDPVPPAHGLSPTATAPSDETGSRVLFYLGLFFFLVALATATVVVIKS